MGISRRSFVKAALGTLGAGAVATAVGLSALELHEYLRWLERPGDRGVVPPDRWVATVCGACPAGCGMVARVLGDRIVKLVGNPFDPIGRGGLCPRGQAGLKMLYQAGRVSGPLKRAGKRGEGKWVEVSWEEALAQVAAALHDLRAKAPHGLGLVTSPPEALFHDLADRFLTAFGSPNHLIYRPITYPGPHPAFAITQGLRTTPSYDVRNAGFLLSFNSGLLDAFASPAETMAAFAHFRQGARRRRGRFVHAGPRLSVTAAKADEWIPIRPGTEGVLAMGLANVIIREQLYDHDFVEQHAFAFEPWQDASGATHPGFRTIALRDYPTRLVSERTGVAWDVLIRLAREFARQPRALALGDDRPGWQETSTRLAIHALNVLVGSFERPGGVLTPRPGVPVELPAFEPADVAKAGLAHPSIMSVWDARPQGNLDSESIPDRILSGKPYALSALILAGADPLAFSPAAETWRAALAKVPLVVSLSAYEDDTTRWADYVLPDHSFLEKWEAVRVTTLGGYAVEGLRQPATRPVRNTRHAGDVLLSLARKLGDDVARHFPWKGYQKLVRVRLEQLFRAKRGDVMGRPQEEAWTQLLEKSGWRSPTFPTFQDFWRNARKYGGWWDPVYYHAEWGRAFKTPSRKFELISPSLLARLGKNAAEGVGAGCYPSKETPVYQGREKESPLRLQLFVPLALGGAPGSLSAWVQGIAAPTQQRNWDTWAEINPVTAKQYDLVDGEWVWLEGAGKQVRCRVKYSEGIPPAVVAVPLGVGRLASADASRRDQDPMAIVSQITDTLSGARLFNRSRVRVRRDAS